MSEWEKPFAEGYKRWAKHLEQVYRDQEAERKYYKGFAYRPFNINKGGSMDVIKELIELLGVYRTELSKIHEQLENKQYLLVSVMKDYVEAFEKKEELEQKMEELEDKMGLSEEEEE